MIRVKNLTKDFGNHKGIFDISFEVQDGEVFGYLGPDGAGKTTTIRQLLGFERPSGGRCFINGKGCQIRQNEIHSVTGYLPEREALPQQMTGLAFLRFMAEMRGMGSIERAMTLVDTFHVDVNLPIKRMSKDMRQCLSIICAFMHSPGVILLDQPMNCLSKQQKHRFSNLIQAEKQHGRTILITSTEFEEIEHICDRVGLLNTGSLVKIDDIAGLRAVKKMAYVVTFDTEEEAKRFKKETFCVTESIGRQVTVSLTGEMTPLIEVLGTYRTVGIEAARQSLDEVFEYYYGGRTNV